LDVEALRHNQLFGWSRSGKLSEKRTLEGDPHPSERKMKDDRFPADLERIA